VAREKGVFVRSLTGADDNHNVIPEDLSNYKVARAGNLVINKMKAWQGSMGIAPCDGIVSPAYFVFDLGIKNSAFGQTLLRSKPYVAHFAQASDGVRIGQWDLAVPAMREIPVLLPPPDEQAAITKFVKANSDRLEKAIRAKRKEIALLSEQKQAIIHRAVTLGLDSSVTLRPSGIRWLGDIPQTWKIWRLKFVANKIVDCLHATPRYSETGTHPAIRTADVTPGMVHVHRAKRISSDDYAKWTARLIPREGDILYSREGERFGIAACVPSGVQLCISQRMMVFRIAHQHSSEFVMWLLNSTPTYAQALQDVMGATAPHVNISTIKNYFLAMPQKAEQEAIVKYIKSETCPIDVAIVKLQREIEFVREYRTRLIADVVTGKLDVRQVAERLSEEEAPDVLHDDVDEGMDSEDAEEVAV
jgi:type I restriction enzyme S subunit